MKAKTVVKVVAPPASLIATVLLAIFGPKIDGVSTSTAATYISIALGVLLAGHHGQKLTSAAARKLMRAAIKASTRRAVSQQQKLMGPFTMYDSITPAKIPRKATAVACYVDGAWPFYRLLAKLFPKAKRLSIAASAAHDAACLDIEAGDATPDEASAWASRQVARGVKIPILYCSASLIPAVLEALTRAGWKREQVKIWSAHYGQGAHICGPHTCGYPQADATQHTSTANYDESLCSPGFI